VIRPEMICPEMIGHGVPVKSRDIQAMGMAGEPGTLAYLAH
jgi:hypothetical protein